MASPRALFTSPIRLSPAWALVVGGLLFAATPAASAHYLWLEPHGQGARLYFGEVNEVRERSPGRLDEIPQPRVWSVPAAAAGATEHRAARLTGAFAVDASVGADLVAMESAYPVRDWTHLGLGMVKPMYYARLSAWPVPAAVPAAPELRLDVQPVPGSGAVRVLFDGEPLAGAKLAVHAPNGWDQEHKADADGQVLLALPWRGQYVLEVIHREPAAGEFQGRRFESVRHRATLTIVRADGIDPAGTGSLAPRHPEH